MSEDLRNKITEQEWASSQQHNKENKNHIQKSKQSRHHTILQRLWNDMPDEQGWLIEINQQQGASTWLTTLPIKEADYTINKNCFWDLLRRRWVATTATPNNLWMLTTLFHARKEAL